MRQQLTLTIDVTSSSSDTIECLLSSDSVVIARVGDNEVELVAQDKLVRKGMLESGVTLDVLVAVGVGIPVNLLSSWIYDKIIRHSSAARLGDRDLKGLSPEELEQEVTSALED